MPVTRQIDTIQKIKAELRAFPGVVVEFDGDAIDFMQAVYRNVTLPLGLRMEAAKIAAPYERLRKNSLELTGKDGGPVLLEQIASAALEAVLAEREKDQGETVLH